VTDQPVDIRMGPNTLSGVGMRLDSQTRQLQVDSRVRGHIAPRDGAPTGHSEKSLESSR
jgi:lipopolysaccharide export system protein LptC